MSRAIILEDLSKHYSIRSNRDEQKANNGLLKRIGLRKADRNSFWALKDISSQINVGDVCGIIGKNGAGKSTLLKILSQITYPTSGSVQLRGKVASLLEVGTGFHPELTGRENVFLNGSILGMSRGDIKNRFDEIVDFAGVDQFIDTPVKHYSSGMYVRLAFSVAAHLEPEILIIDEVLAVGDADFQKKCLGRMKTVSGQGRTVIFVSHNLDAVSALCNKAIVLKSGKKIFDGEVQGGISEYLAQSAQNESSLSWIPQEPIAGINLELVEIKIQPKSLNDQLEIGDGFDIKFTLNGDFKDEVPSITFVLSSESGAEVFMTSSYYRNKDAKESTGSKQVEVSCAIPPYFMNEGKYIISRLIIFKASGKINLELTDIFTFDVIFNPETIFGLDGRNHGPIRPNFEWRNQY